MKLGGDRDNRNPIFQTPAERSPIELYPQNFHLVEINRRPIQGLHQMLQTKKCSNCKEEKTIDLFYTRSQSGKKYPESRCKKCSILRTKQRKEENPEYATRYREISLQRTYKKNKDKRQLGLLRTSDIYHNSKKSDQKYGRNFDLDKDFIDEQIAQPCVYCGDSSSMMSLDRIDNDIGHIKSNVVPACSRCNLTRNNMPYEAWLVVSEGMRKAFQLGLFEGWSPRKK